MNTQPGIGAAEALILNQPIAGPWLGIRSEDEAEIASLVLCGELQSPECWRRTDAEQPPTSGYLANAHVVPLSAFGVTCSLYSHSKILSVRVIGASSARRFGHPAGGRWIWAGRSCDRIRVVRSAWNCVALAVDEMREAARFAKAAVE